MARKDKPHNLNWWLEWRPLSSTTLVPNSKNSNVSASICSVFYFKTKTIPKKMKLKTFSKFSSVFHHFVLSERLKRTVLDKESHWERWKTLQSLLKYFHLSSSKEKTNNPKKQPKNPKQVDPGSAMTWLFANLQQNHKSFWSSFRKIRKSIK